MDAVRAPRGNAHAKETGARPIDVSPYVAQPAITWWPDDSGDSPRWDTVEGSLVFGDVSGFTNMSERLARHGKVGAEEVADAINNCFDALLGVAHRQGGQLLKFGGDALLLLFTGDDHALRAAHAALDMRTQLRSVGRIDTSSGRVVLRISIGVHSGPVTLFLVGGSHRELIALGPGISAVVECESTATAGEIVMSATTSSLLPRRCQGRPRGNGFLLRSPGPTRAPQATPTTAPVAVNGARFVPTAVRRHLLGGGTESEHRNATVAFLHFDGTDELLASEGPATLAQRIDDVVRTVQEVADRHQVCFLGTDADHDGGKIILTAGVPNREGDDEERMLTTLVEINKANLALGLRIGVNNGAVFAGDIGTRVRRTFTVMGDTVNLAARLMARAETGQILATDEALRRSNLRLVTSPVEPFLVKGKRRPVNAAIIRDIDRGRNANDLQLPFVGRDDALGQLEALHRDASHGQGRTFVIRGGPGMGKSRLLGEFHQRHPDQPWITLWCEQFEATRPYAVVHQLVRRLLDVGPDRDRSEIERRLRELVTSSLPEFGDRLPLLGTAFGLDIEDSIATARLQPEFRRASVEASTADFLLRLLPVGGVLVIEDTHYLDEASASVIERMTDSLASFGVLCGLTTRNLDDGKVSDDRLLITLPPLSDEEATFALRRATDDSPLLPATERAIVERSAGQPSFLEELWRAVRQGAGPDDLPDSMMRATAAQIDRLTPRDRMVLRSASVLGLTFDLRSLVDLLDPSGTGDDNLRLGLDGKFSSGLEEFLQPTPDGRFRFQSGVIRECAYEGLPYRRRRELHGRAARSLTARFGANLSDHVDTLSQHYFNAGDFANTWPCAIKAGELAAEKFANEDAVVAYTRALHSLNRLPDVPRETMGQVARTIGELQEHMGEFDSSKRSFEQARKLFSSDPGARSEISVLQAIVAERVGNYSQAVRWCNRGLKELAGQTGKDAIEVRARLLAWLATVRQAQGKNRQAIAVCQEAIEEARRAGSIRHEASALVVMDLALINMGKAAKATHSARALEMFEEINDLVKQVQTLGNMGHREYYLGRWNHMVEHYLRSAELALQTGDEVFAAVANGNIGEVRSDQGRFEEAEILISEAVRTLRAAGYRYSAANTAGFLGRLLGRTGRFEEAHRELAEARKNLEDIGAPVEIFDLDSFEAECLVFEARSDKALALTDRLLTAPEATESARGDALLQRIRGYACLQLGRMEEAREGFTRSLATAEALDLPYEQLLTLVAQRNLNDPLDSHDANPSTANRIDELQGRLGIETLPDVPVGSPER